MGDLADLLGQSGAALAVALLIIGRLFASYVNKHFFAPYLRLKAQELEERKASRAAMLSASRGLHRVGGALEHGSITYKPRVVRDSERSVGRDTAKHGTGESETDRVYRKEVL